MIIENLALLRFNYPYKRTKCEFDYNDVLDKIKVGKKFYCSTDMNNNIVDLHAILTKIKYNKCLFNLFIRDECIDAIINSCNLNKDNINKIEDFIEPYYDWNKRIVLFLYKNDKEVKKTNQQYINYDGVLTWPLITNIQQNNFVQNENVAIGTNNVPRFTYGMDANGNYRIIENR